VLELWTKYGNVQKTIAAYRAAGRTELPALPVVRDVKVIAHRALRFEDEGGSFYVAPWMHPQTIPERFLNQPYFQSAKKNGWVEVISDPVIPQQAKAKKEVTEQSPQRVKPISTANLLEPSKTQGSSLPLSRGTDRETRERAPQRSL
jgi:hypothetical protein